MQFSSRPTASNITFGELSTRKARWLMCICKPGAMGLLPSGSLVDYFDLAGLSPEIS
jgi:hypothetical protein